MRGRQRKTIFTAAEEALLKTDTPIKDLSALSLFAGRQIRDMHNWRWNYRNPKIKKTPLSDEEEELLKGNTPLEELVKLPLFAGRLMVTLKNKRESFRKNTIKRAKVIRKEDKPRSTGLYQFISIAEATTERKKQW